MYWMDRRTEAQGVDGNNGGTLVRAPAQRPASLFLLPILQENYIVRVDKRDGVGLLLALLVLWSGRLSSPLFLFFSVPRGTWGKGTY